MPKSSHSFVLSVSMLFAGHSIAGGLWINEFGDPIMGRAGAGSLSGLDDAGAALHNPASMVRLDSDQFMATGGIIASKINFDVATSAPLNGNDNGGDAGGVVPSGSVFYVHTLDDKWKLGIYAGAFTGAALDYNDEWVGRFQAQYVELLVAGAMPSLSYQVTDRFSVGVGVPVLYGSLEMDVALPGATRNGAQATLDGSDTQVGLNLSAYYEVAESTRLGLMYQSEFEFEFDGDADIKNFLGSPKLSIDTEIPLAEYVKGSISHDFSDSFSGHVTVGWEGWSRMDSVIISGENNAAALAKDWEDIWHYAAGVEYAFNPSWSMNAGLRYDESVTRAQKRTADMAIDDQMRYALGVTYQRHDKLTIGAHMVYADYGDGEIITENSITTPGGIEIPTGFSGDYKDNDLLFFSVSFNWRLGD